MVSFCFSLQLSLNPVSCIMERTQWSLNFQNSFHPLFRRAFYFSTFGQGFINKNVFRCFVFFIFLFKDWRFADEQKYFRSFQI